MKLHIKCHTEASGQLAELGIEGEGSTEYRPLWLSADKVNYFYPNPDGETFINVGGDDLTVQEAFGGVYDQYHKEL